MADQDIEQKLQQLRNKVKAAEDIKKRARAELEQLKASVTKKRSKYLRLKMENDQLDIDVEVQLARLASEGERADNCWSKIEDELSDKMNKMDVALSGIDAEKAETNSMVLSHFRSIRDIPKNFSEEAMQRKTIELEKECDAKLAAINEQEKQIADEKAKLAAEKALGRKDNDNADAFLKELKFNIVEIETLIRRRNETTSK